MFRSMLVIQKEEKANEKHFQAGVRVSVRLGGHVG